MKVLHLASFNGNIGDNANHSGFRPWLEKIAGRKMDWVNLEIREYYWKERAFDQTFVDLANEFELIIVGGGNYFELWVDKSHTGTSIDIPIDLFRKIKTPIFFNALGCDAGQGVTENSVGRFNKFLEFLVGSPQYLVTVRNDGAKKTLRKYVPASIAEKVATIPDGGFFLEYEDVNVSYLDRSIQRIGINLACDMPEVRFRNFGGSGYDGFCDEFAKTLIAVSEENREVHFIFFPHIHSDLKIISDIVSKLGDRLRRTRMSTAPYVTGSEGARYMFGLYRQCSLILGMRFHANVCALGMGIETIGLNNYTQIEFLYEELGYAERCFGVRSPGFSIALRKLILETLNGKGATGGAARVMEEMHLSRKSFEPALSDWLNANSLGKDS